MSKLSTPVPPSPLALTAQNTLLKAEIKAIRKQARDLRHGLELVREEVESWRMTLPRAAEWHRENIEKIIYDTLGAEE